MYQNCIKGSRKLIYVEKPIKTMEVYKHKFNLSNVVILGFAII